MGFPPAFPIILVWRIPLAEQGERRGTAKASHGARRIVPGFGGAKSVCELLELRGSASSAARGAGALAIEYLDGAEAEGLKLRDVLLELGVSLERN